MPTVLHRLAAWASSDPNSAAQTVKINGKWESITAREFCDCVYWLALYLESQGMTANDIGTIFSYNCPEWVQMDLAPALLGAKSAGIYPNSSPKDLQYILTHTESRFLTVQNREYFQKITDEKGGVELLDRISLILVFDGDTSISPKAVAYSSAIAEGKRLATKAEARSLSDYLKKIEPNQGAFLIYTSGTTGSPKGAVISHDNIVFAIEAIARHWDLPMAQGSLFSFLPLCHAAEKIQNLGASICLRYNVFYCTSFDNLATELREVQPSFILCVPRIWEKMMEGVMNKLDQGSILQRKVGYWALKIGERFAHSQWSKESLTLIDWIQWRVADRLVLSKVRQGLGLSQAKAASGAAALSPVVYEWLASIGLEINEGYGQTESTGVICMTERGVNSVGTVGTAVKGVEVKLAEDGEILTRGRHVFIGYFKDEAATAQVLVNGWLHTGDLGEIDKRGYYRIRGRKKEIMKTSGGKMIAPLPIEEALKNSPLISQACMVGDGQKYLCALITLSEPKLSELSKAKVNLNDREIKDAQVVKELRHAIDQVNSNLATYERIKKFAILSKEFSLAAGEVTPTLKMKRKVIETHYQDVIQQLYSADTR